VTARPLLLVVVVLPAGLPVELLPPALLGLLAAAEVLLTRLLIIAVAALPNALKLPLVPLLALVVPAGDDAAAPPSNASTNL